MRALHMNRADEGNGQFLGPDLYFDDLFAMAGTKTYMSAEKIIATEDFLREGPVHTLKIPRTHVDGVVEAPMGAHFTECPPDYGRDEAFQREYAATAKDPEAWAQFRADWLELESHEAYRAKLEKGAGVRTPPKRRLPRSASSPSPRRSVATVRCCATRWAPCR